jgi:transposase-like protein
VPFDALSKERDVPLDINGAFIRIMGGISVTNLLCKKCAQSRYVKSGTIRGHQRYLCLDCGCHFTATAARGKPPAMKALAVLLYAMGNATHEMIAQLLGVSHDTVYKWIPKKTENMPEPSAKASDRAVQIDEMRHFVDGGKVRFGPGESSILWQGEPWPGSWVAVMMRPAKGISVESGLKETSSERTTGRVSDSSFPQVVSEVSP